MPNEAMAPHSRVEGAQGVGDEAAVEAKPVESCCAAVEIAYGLGGRPALLARWHRQQTQPRSGERRLRFIVPQLLLLRGLSRPQE